MDERNVKRGAAVPFYAPSKRKTSAEIISEARAAIGGEMSPASSGLGALRPAALRTRRPYTPRDPQRVLFADRSRKRDGRPPSSFDLKYLSLSEDSEDAQYGRSKTFDAAATDLDDIFGDSNRTRPKQKSLCRAVSEQVSEWGGAMKLPHLSGRSKPLHRRGASGSGDGGTDLSDAILVTRPLDSSITTTNTNYDKYTKSLSPNEGSKRNPFTNSKSVSNEGGISFGHVAVKCLDIQLPSAKIENYENMNILEITEELSRKSRDVDHILHIMEILQKLLDKTPPASSLRDLVLRALYTHIDCDDERVLVAIARSMLTMRVTGPHLAAACKLVFKIARNDKNDHFFLDGNLLELLVEGCGRLEPVSESECCVYAAGALRFLALEPRLCQLAHRVGALHIAVLHLKILNDAMSQGQCGDGQAQALYQVAGALRGLASVTPHVFANSGALPELLVALEAHTHRDVITNVARCLSVLSADESCCLELCGRAGAARALLGALSACAARAPLAVRLAYTLGNMAAADCRAALHIYKEEGAVDVLLTILESYTQRVAHNVDDAEADPDLHLVDSDLGGSDGSNEDVLIKTIRVLANLCLAEQAGEGLATVYALRLVTAMIACLHLVENSTKIKDSSEESKRVREERNNELALASLAALNNVSFYLQAVPTLSIENILDELCIVSCRWLCSGVAGAAGEAARVLGNLSRSSRAAQLLVLHDALDTIATLQQHDDASVRCAAAGVLVNVCGCGGRDACAAAAAVAARALHAAARVHDTATAALLARALWNAHAHAPLEYDDAKRAATALSAFLEDESIFTACELSAQEGRRSPQLIKSDAQFIVSDDREAIKNDKSKELYKHLDNDVIEEDGSDEDGERTGCSGEDLGFEEGDLEECDCEPCQRLAAWDELMGVAIPLLEKLKPTRTDVAVGTD
ncbi:armadillo repeat-containing protein 2 isoform X2 [Aricia agestis]|uniref:armadillo repeat-containing protein 2 isoform X2 n=1 Tax=Aricia agestis TaxID=91739 RepID=UPI001C204CA4|nr:armadillo repeat-containing protein 2 isoform X2 [Aricia agestis]